MKNLIKRIFGFDTDAGLNEQTPELTVRPMDIEDHDLSREFEVHPGDTVTLYYDEYSESAGDVTTTKLMQGEITEPMVINRAVIFKFTDALGFSHAVGAAVGTKKEQV